MFAKNGSPQATGFDSGILINQVNELRGHIKVLSHAIATVENVLLWRAGFRMSSIAFLIAWQLLVSYPHFVPASFGLLPLLFMNNTRVTEQDAINAKPGFFSLVSHATLTLILFAVRAPQRSSPSLTSQFAFHRLARCCYHANQKLSTSNPYQCSKQRTPKRATKKTRKSRA